MRIPVYNNNIDSALKKMKKVMFEEGIIEEIMRARYYEKPSDKRRRKKKENIARFQKERNRLNAEL